MSNRRVRRARALPAVLAVVVCSLTLWAVLDGGLAVPESRDGADAPTRSSSVAEPRRTSPLPGKVLDTIGVASFNALQYLKRPAATRDWRRITAKTSIDLIGWQESKSASFRALYPQFRQLGWETWYYPSPDGPIQLAVSWRAEVFALEHTEIWRMHRGGYPRQTKKPFPARWVVGLTFRHRASGRTVTLLNTHVNQGIETGQGFTKTLNATYAKRHLRRLAGLWNSVRGDVVVGTGDYNFDYNDDARARPNGGITSRFRGKAVSSYQALGLVGTEPTRRTRWIDYVFLARRSIRSPAQPGRSSSGAAQFVRHETLDGFASDHLPLLARIRLYE